MIYISQILKNTLNIYGAVCQLYLDKTKRKKKFFKFPRSFQKRHGGLLHVVRAILQPEWHRIHRNTPFWDGASGLPWFPTPMAHWWLAEPCPSTSRDHRWLLPWEAHSFSAALPSNRARRILWWWIESQFALKEVVKSPGLKAVSFVKYSVYKAMLKIHWRLIELQQLKNLLVRGLQRSGLKERQKIRPESLQEAGQWGWN